MEIFELGSKMIYQQEINLQFVWAKCLFDQQELYTTCGQKVEILDSGSWNTNSGPDFLFAKILIDGILHVGQVELHLKSSDWIRHGHQQDDQYKNVILHVVLVDDINPSGLGLDHIPCLVLLPFMLLSETRVMRLRAEDNRSDFHCLKGGEQIDFSGFIEQMSDRLIAERMDRKANTFFNLLKSYRGDYLPWVMACVAAYFAGPLNRFGMEELARHTPFDVFKHYRQAPLQMEALYLGQAGLLEGKLTDAYSKAMKERYTFLKGKHQLKGIPKNYWKYFRLRPYAFPDRRVVLFAAFASTFPIEVERFLLAKQAKDLYGLLQFECSSYWKERYRLGAESSKQLHVGLSKQLKDLLLINAFIPMIIALGKYRGQGTYTLKAFQFLKELPWERNKIARAFIRQGVRFKTAFDTQAAIELKQSYCTKFKCLSCDIGCSVFKSMDRT